MEDNDPENMKTLFYCSYHWWKCICRSNFKWLWDISLKISADIKKSFCFESWHVGVRVEWMGIKGFYRGANLRYCLWFLVCRQCLLNHKPNSESVKESSTTFFDFPQYIMYYMYCKYFVSFALVILWFILTALFSPYIGSLSL